MSHSYETFLKIAYQMPHNFFFLKGECLNKSGQCFLPSNPSSKSILIPLMLALRRQSAKKWSAAQFSICNFLPIPNVIFPSLIAIDSILHSISAHRFLSQISPSSSLFEFLVQSKLHLLLWKWNELKGLLKTVACPHRWSFCSWRWASAMINMGVVF